jgi:uncharacterized protein YjbI with pentapeptide repeats
MCKLINFHHLSNYYLCLSADTTADKKEFDKTVVDMMAADKTTTTGPANTEKAIDMEQPDWTNTTQVAETGIEMPAGRMQVENCKMKKPNWLDTVPTASVDTKVSTETACNQAAEAAVDFEPIASVDNTNCSMNMMAENTLVADKWAAEDIAETVNTMAAGRTVDTSEERMSAARKSVVDMSVVDTSVVDTSAARRFVADGTSVEHMSAEDSWVVGNTAVDKTVAGDKLAAHTSEDKRVVDTKGADRKGADMTGVDRKGVDMKGADMTEADMKESDTRVDKKAGRKGDKTATDRVPVDKMTADKMSVSDKMTTGTEEISSLASIPQRH